MGWKDAIDTHARPTRRSADRGALLVPALLVLLILTTGAGVYLDATMQSQSPTWEHKIVGVPDEHIEDKLNELGRQGWQVVSARRAMTGDDLDRTALYELILKRRVE